MSGKPFTVTRSEARELRRRAERVRRTGGVPHAEVVAELRKDMERELRQMVREYRHPSAKLREILECMAIAHADGIDVSALCGDLLEKIAATHRRAA
jgi:hypothetical protein